MSGSVRSLTTNKRVRVQYALLWRVNFKSSDTVDCGKTQGPYFLPKCHLPGKNCRRAVSFRNRCCRAAAQRAFLLWARGNT